MVGKLLYLVLKAFALLPLKVLYLFAGLISFVLHDILGYRKKMVRKNLFSAFPYKSKKELGEIESEFYRFLGVQIVETLKLLHISDAEIKKRVTVVNYEEVNQTLSQSRNAVLLMGHYCNWEWAQEITRYFLPETFMASIYHPLSNPLWDEIFIKLRSRWNAHIVPMRKATRVLLNKDNMPWVCGFIADAYTWRKHDDNWIEFLNHKTWFIYGPEEIGRKVKADFFYLEMVHIKRGHYKIIFHKLEPEDNHQTFPYTREFWRKLEKTIENDPPYWLWSHNRWK